MEPVSPFSLMRARTPPRHRSHKRTANKGELFRDYLMRKIAASELPSRASAKPSAKTWIPAYAAMTMS
jgi:hypothetical protein